MESTIKVILVEDDALCAFYMSFQLRKLGFGHVTTVASGEEAVSCAKRERPDIILMDINLEGEMNGIEAIRQIKEGSDIPVIFITGYSDEGIKARADAIGPAAYFVKPVDMRELGRKIESVVTASTGKAGPAG